MFNRRTVPVFLAKCVLIFSAAWAIMVLPWPWAHEAPLMHPIEAMRVAASFTSSYTVLFEGAGLSSDALPRRYLVQFLLITTPPAVLLLALLGVVSGFQRWRSKPLASYPFALTLLWFLVPIGVFTILRPNVYDGIRHFLFVLPPICCVAMRLPLTKTLV